LLFHRVASPSIRRSHSSNAVGFGCSPIRIPRKQTCACKKGFCVAIKWATGRSRIVRMNSGEIVRFCWLHVSQISGPFVNQLLVKIEQSSSGGCCAGCAKPGILDAETFRRCA
jgi:hypothetical protein